MIVKQPHINNIGISIIYLFVLGGGFDFGNPYHVNMALLMPTPTNTLAYTNFVPDSHSHIFKVTL